MATALYTIGYEGTDIRRFLETLTSVGIEVLADVRAVPISRKAGFSKKVLELGLAGVGIKYAPFRELGDPKPGRDAAREGRIADFRAIYGNHLRSPLAVDALGALAAVALESRTCLLCFERDPSLCHRSMIAAALASRGMQAVDLFGDDPQRYVRNRLLIDRGDHHKGPAAA